LFCDSEGAIGIVTVIIMMRYADDDLWLLFVHHQQGFRLAADSDLDSILTKSVEGIEAKTVEVAKHSIWRLVSTSWCLSRLNRDPAFLIVASRNLSCLSA